MKCSQCGNELTEDMFNSDMCFACGQAVTISEKAVQDQLEAEQKAREQELKEQLEAQRRELAERTKNHMLTTGFSFEDYHIEKYFGLVSGEIVIGTGFISDMIADISDTFGLMVSVYSDKIKAAKQAALAEMIKESVERGANGIIGISYSYLRYARDLIGVSVNDTSVRVKQTIPK